MGLEVKASSPQVSDSALRLPTKFPEVPKEVVARFPSMGTWMDDVTRFWSQNQNAVNDFARAVLDVTEVAGVLVVDPDSASLYIKRGRGPGKWADADTGFFVDRESYFSLGSSLTWNPKEKELTIVGTIIATAGEIGGFDIGTDYIRDAANSFGLSSVVTAGDDVRFWAGDTFANRGTAPFRVYESGALAATNATLTGNVTIAATNYVLVTNNATYLTWQGGAISTPGIFFQHDAASAKGIGILAVGTNSTSVITLNKARGTFGSLSAATTDDVMGQIRYYAYDGSNFLAMGVNKTGITNSVATPYYYINVGGSGASNYYWIFNYDGKMYFAKDGEPANSLGAPYMPDATANLYRSAAGSIKTDGNFMVAGNFEVGSGGTLKFGIFNALGGAALTGYFNILDSSGNARKLAIVGP